MLARTWADELEFVAHEGGAGFDENEQTRLRQVAEHIPGSAAERDRLRLDRRVVGIDNVVVRLRGWRRRAARAGTSA